MRILPRTRLVRAAILLAIALFQLGMTVRMGDRPSTEADSFGEGNILRAGEGYSVKGFRADYGLPDVLFGSQFPEDGSRASDPRESFVYTHYPPGPYWIVGLLTRALGPGRIRLYRLFVIAFGLLCVSRFGHKLVQNLGEGAGTTALVLCAAVPMFSLMMHSLEFHGTFAVLLLELALLLPLMSRPLRRAEIWALAGLGFVQGWVSFDWFFVVCLAPLPVGLLSPRDDRIRSSVLASLVLAVGCCSAFGLHFLQVVGYRGGWNPALADWTDAFRTRVGLPGDDPGLAHTLYVYVFSYAPHWRQLSYPLGIVTALAAFLLWSRRGSLELGRINRSLIWDVGNGGREKLALLAAGLSSLAWVALFRQHALHHAHFLPRHLFLFYFVAVLVIVSRTRESGASDAEPGLRARTLAMIEQGC